MTSRIFVGRWRYAAHATPAPMEIGSAGASGPSFPRRPPFRSSLIFHRALRKGMVRRYVRSDGMSSMSAPAALGHGSRLERHPRNH
jgi:hypothetical protein